MKQAAAEQGRPDAHAVTLSRSIVEPFLTYSDVRRPPRGSLPAWSARGENGGESDNRAIVAQTLALRQEKAGLLGYESFAAYKLDDTMAKTPGAVSALLTMCGAGFAAGGAGRRGNCRRWRSRREQRCR